MINNQISVSIVRKIARNVKIFKFAQAANRIMRLNALSMITQKFAIK